MSRHRVMLVFLVVALALGALAVPAAGARKVPHVKHVFIVVLENKNWDRTFGKHTEAPYLAHRLRHRGAYVPNYYGIAHESAPNYLAMISGQAPNPDTQADCQVYSDFLPGIPTSDGQYVGQGCVYPNGVETIANQLEDSGYLWKAYMEDMNADAPAGKEDPCRHPGLNQQDHTQSAHVGDQYAARHNPFVYFHAIIDFPTCASHDVDLSHLRHDLRHRATTPNYSFIVPNLCHDGHDHPCVNGQPGGLRSANKWLRHRIPRILHSAAFHNRGLLIVTFDEAEAPPGEQSGTDARACCNEQPGPNTANPGGPIPGAGGGKVGAVLVSPCIRPRTVSKVPYNHYSLLRSVERNFKLPFLGYAGQSGLRPFGRDVLNRRGCGRR
jgi:phosphatidylinositol-3-phosphatase